MTVVFSRWQDVISALPLFDAVFFDPFDGSADFAEFYVHLPNDMKET